MNITCEVAGCHWNTSFCITWTVNPSHSKRWLTGIAHDVRTAQLLETGPEGNAVGVAHEVAGAGRGVARGLRVDMTAGHRVVGVLGQRRADRGPDREAPRARPPSRHQRAAARSDHAAMVTTGASSEECTTCGGLLRGRGEFLYVFGV